MQLPHVFAFLALSLIATATVIPNIKAIPEDPDVPAKALSPREPLWQFLPLLIHKGKEKVANFIKDDSEKRDLPEEPLEAREIAWLPWNYFPKMIEDAKAKHAEYLKDKPKEPEQPEQPLEGLSEEALKERKKALEEEIDRIKKTAKEEEKQFEEPALRQEMALQEEREREVQRIRTVAQLEKLKLKDQVFKVDEQLKRLGN